jgi:hypothetical protein
MLNFASGAAALTEPASATAPAPTTVPVNKLRRDTDPCAPALDSDELSVSGTPGIVILLHRPRNGPCLHHAAGAGFVNGWQA